jgi:hypothetical protein
LKGKKKEKWRKKRGAKIKPTKITFTPKIACTGLMLLIIMNSPIFQVAKERTKHAKSRWAIFLGLLERTIRQRVRFIAKASAAGSARIFIGMMINKTALKVNSIFLEKESFEKLLHAFSEISGLFQSSPDASLINVTRKE